MSDWSDFKASWKASSASSFDAEKIRLLRNRIEKDVRRSRIVSRIELLATVVIAAYLAWQGLIRSSVLESSILLLIAIVALAVQVAIIQMRHRLARTTAETAKALWTLKIKRARLARRIALFGLVAGPTGVLSGYLLAIHQGMSTVGDSPIVTVPVAVGCLVLFAGGMIYSALEARRAKQELSEALATLAWLGDDEA